MAITLKEIEYIAKLARLGLNEKENDEYSKEVSDILDYMDKLNEADIKNVELMVQVTGLKSIFRNDENPHKIDPEKIRKIIGRAPEKESNFVKTKPILEK